MLSSLFSAYPSFLVFLGFIVATALTMALMPAWIRLLTRTHIGQQVRADGPQSHLVKQGTPTMGGVIMLIAIVITVLLVVPPSWSFVAALLATLCTAALGLFDDAEKVIHERSLGLTPKGKLIGQFAIATLFTLYVVNWLGIAPPCKSRFAAVEFQACSPRLFRVPSAPMVRLISPGCTSCSAICSSSACPMR